FPSYPMSLPSTTKRRHLPKVGVQDYTVGWVCALPVELAAAMVMLDEEHEALPDQPEGDNNVYTLGRIGEHNIVIACLPAGQMGITSAATVVSQMMARFTAVRLRLMVGIGGGVPSSEHDIRLGDEVISEPHMGYGGVIQYDFGKAMSGGFMHTGSLNAPPQPLLNALNVFKAKRMKGECNIAIQLPKFSHLPGFAFDQTRP